VIHGDKNSNGVQEKSGLKVYRCSIGVQEEKRGTGIQK